MVETVASQQFTDTKTCSDGCCLTSRYSESFVRGKLLVQQVSSDVGRCCCGKMGNRKQTMRERFFMYRGGDVEIQEARKTAWVAFQGSDGSQLKHLRLAALCEERYVFDRSAWKEERLTRSKRKKISALHEKETASDLIGIRSTNEAVHREPAISCSKPCKHVTVVSGLLNSSCTSRHYGLCLKTLNVYEKESLLRCR